MTAKIVEYHFRCFCGTPIVTTEKTATCVACGKTLGIRRVKKHRRKWYAFPRPVHATSGWLWRKGLVESVAERRFRFQCACGSTIVTAEKTTTCASCGEAISLHRVMKRLRPEVIVEYEFACCFCGRASVTTAKTLHCAGCEKRLKIVRGGRHGTYWKTVPYSADQETIKQKNGRTLLNFLALGLLLGLSLCSIYSIAQGMHDLANNSGQVNSEEQE